MLDYTRPATIEEMEKVVKFLADKCQVRSNLAGGNSTVTLSTGEYELTQLAKLLLIPQDVEIQVKIEW